MTNEDKYALTEFLVGAATVVGVIAIFIIFVFFLSNKTVNVNTSPSTEVVGKYKECEIVRWNSNNLAEYKYFLYCNKN